MGCDAGAAAASNQAKACAINSPPAIEAYIIPARRRIPQRRARGVAIASSLPP
ncbi:hypothetical protein PCLA_15r0154 [Pseudomonas citronellolis]|nr:hypothetical protein PCLA_15r0154 [Pseudomonas citronellolis]